MKKYEYVMESSEIREFCAASLWEQLKCRKGVWIRLLLIMAAELFIIPEAAVMLAVMLIVMFLASGIFNYRAITRILEGQPWSVWVEGDKLKVVRGDYSEVSCRNIQFIRMTKHLLMLGYLQSVKRPAWFIVPLRVFVDEKEREMFVARIRNPQTQAAAEYENAVGTGAGYADMTGQGMVNTAPQEYMRFTYMLDGERWVRFQKGAADILNSSSLGKPARFYGMIVWGCVMAAATTGCAYFVAGTLNWMLVCFCLAISIWMILRIYCCNPEKSIRKQLMAPEIAAKACGRWQVSLSEEGIAVSMPMEMKNFYSWESVEWLLEKEEVFYIFHKDKKHYIMIAKESFLSWAQVDGFHRLCADKGVRKTAAKQVHYVPGWLTWVWFGLIIGVSFVTLMVKIFLDREDENLGGVPLEEQAKVLESLGLHVPEEKVESIRESMVEYDLYDMVEDSPYTWLLMDMGAPEYDEEWNLVGYSEEVFWFDFEGYDISTDYIDVLNGMKALAQGSCLDRVENIEENTENMDWEKGRGTITVSLTRDGQVYAYDMEVYYDWIDDKVLGVFNDWLEQEESEEYFYVTGDNGQGAIVFFCTAKWADQFTAATGLQLERYP